MKKMTDFIVDKRYLILFSFIVLTIISIFLMTKVNINHDISKYLPNDSETRQGMNIMDKEFKATNSSSYNIMFKGLNNDEKKKIYDELVNTKNVKSVDYDDSSDYNKGDYTYYVINVEDTKDGKISSNVYKEIENRYNEYDVKTSGDIASYNKPVLHTWIVAFAIGCAMIILIFMCDSYIHPFLILFTVGLAVFINKGTNIMFSSVSHITNSIVAILQMALSMDYAIMLINRYNQEKKNYNNKIDAMKEALAKSFSSIASSSVTTIVGLLALVFMSFTIGKDLGFVLAKGVLLSLISILFCLPCLLLIFDRLIEKTHKKVINPKLKSLGKFEFKIRYISIPTLLILFLASYLLKGNLGILYTDTEMNEVAQQFTLNNQMAVVYNNKDEEKIAEYCNKLENEDHVKQVLCYGNTIGQKLKYDELLDKLSTLSQDVDIDEYLVKIIYYNYYNKDKSNKMTFEEFMKFINNEVYNNEKISEKLDSNSKENLNKLKYFTYKDEYNKKRTSKEISSILGIDKNKTDLLFIYYNSKNINNKLSIEEFVNFVTNKVLTNPLYSSEISSQNKTDLLTLKKFTNKNTITTKLTSSEMSKLFGIDKKTVDSLYTYYNLTNNIDIKLTIEEFVNFVLSDVINNKDYSNYFNKETISSLNTLKVFTNKSFINKNLSIKELSNVFGLDKESVKGILFLYYSQISNTSTYTLKEVLNNITYLSNNTAYLNDMDLSSFNKLSVFIKNENNFNTTKYDKNTLDYIFSNIDSNLVNLVYTNLGLSDEYKLSISEFLNLTITNLGTYMDSSSLQQLKVLQLIVNDSINPKKYNVSELSFILGINKEKINTLYTLIDYINNNTDNWNLSSYKFVNVLLNNKNNSLISNKLNSNTITKLELLNRVMESTNNNIAYDYNTLSKLLSIDNNTIKSIYVLYKQSNHVTKLTPNEFVKFILNHKNDTLLKGKVNNSMLNKLNLLNKVMNSTINNTKYTSKQLSVLLNMDQDKLNLLYSLYEYNDSKTLSIKEFVNFIVNTVMNDSKYSSNIDSSSKNKIKTINSIISSTDKEIKYTNDEIFAILSNLSDDLDKSMIEVLYIYFGSEKEYNDDWKLTIEEFINYINDDVITDSRFIDFINDEMKDKIKSSKDKVMNAKDLLVGDNYSRVVINTDLAPEGKDTFDFINNEKNNVKKYSKDFYFIGNSPMALDMSESFGSELDFITILTMIAIFVAVAITFKSLLIPTILVFIIQCAVYLTMGILTMLGGTVYFIALLIVQSILMGATIDYAIVYTSYYIESRESMNVKESIINSYQKSIHTILTSSSILIIVTFIVGNFANAIASKICMTLSRGTLCSVILILTLLPAILAITDKIIIKKKTR